MNLHTIFNKTLQHKDAYNIRYDPQGAWATFSFVFKSVAISATCELGIHKGVQEWLRGQTPIWKLFHSEVPIYKISFLGGICCFIAVCSKERGIICNSIFQLFWHNLKFHHTLPNCLPRLCRTTNTVCKLYPYAEQLSKMELKFVKFHHIKSTWRHQRDSSWAKTQHGEPNCQWSNHNTTIDKFSQMPPLSWGYEKNAGSVTINLNCYVKNACKPLNYNR